MAEAATTCASCARATDQAERCTGDGCGALLCLGCASQDGACGDCLARLWSEPPKRVEPPRVASRRSIHRCDPGDIETELRIGYAMMRHSGLAGDILLASSAALWEARGWIDARAAERGADPDVVGFGGCPVEAASQVLAIRSEIGARPSEASHTARRLT